MKRGIIVIFFCWWGMVAYGQYQKVLEQLLDAEEIKHAAVGISVKQVSDGREVMGWNADMALTPASVMKIIPTWFALQEKGRDYQYHTYVYYTGNIVEGVLSGDIVVKAAGDPTIDSRFFPENKGIDTIVAAIEKLGIRHIRGKIILKGTKVGTDIPGSWPWEDISNYYAALYLPFNYRDNLFTLKLKSGEVGSKAELIAIDPFLPGVEIRNEVKAGENNRDNAWIMGGPFSSVLCVRGSIPARQAVFRVKGAMHDPASVFVQELTNVLQQKNIVLQQANTGEKAETLLVEICSPRLEEIVYYTNKTSVNLFAEALGHLAGGGKWLKQVPDMFARIGIDASGITLNDACGLSPMNAVPAQLLTDLLIHISRQKDSVFVRSLPVAGIDGGLAGYCYSWPGLKNHMKAKTGSMTGVRSLAGFLSNQSGELFAFTVLVNHYTCTTSQLQKAIGKFLNNLYTLPGRN